VICQALNLDDQPPLAITDLQNAVAHVYVAPAFIELAETDDVGSQSQDVVHPREREVFAGLRLEQDSAGAFNRHLRAIAELDGATDHGVDDYMKLDLL
jgi:hypothetical protein